jgi:excisionase family DNA binding protein
VSDDPDSTDMSYSDEHNHRSTYTVEEVARILGILRTTAYECVRRGDIQARRFGRRVVAPTIVSVKLTDECPSRSLTTLAFTPAASRCDACVWRRSWRRILGSPDDSTSR